MRNSGIHPVGRLLPLLAAAILAFTFYFRPGVATAEEAPRAELKRVASSMNVTFEASCQALAAALNQMMGNEIYRGATRVGGLSADIMRSGPMGLTAADNYLYLTVPVTMTLRYGSFSAPPISSKLKFRLTAKVTPDWKLNAEIYYMGLSDQFADEVGIGLLSFKPRSIIEGITQPLQKVMSEVISRKINEKYSLRAEIEKVWSAAQKPVLLDKAYNAWLKITPQDIVLYPLYAMDNQVKLSLGLKSLAELVVGPELPVPASVPLPALKAGNGGDKSFRVALNTNVFYKDLLTIAAPLLLNRELGSDGKSILLKSLDIYSSGDKLAVKAKAEGSYNGVFSLTCRPSFNPQTNVFSVEDVDFDMDTRNILLKTANWLLHGKIRNTIKENLNMNLTQRMQQLHEMAQKAMEQVKLAEHIFLRGRVKGITLQDVAVQRDRISIRVYAEGETAVNFQ